MEREEGKWTSMRVVRLRGGEKERDEESRTERREDRRRRGEKGLNEG